MSGHHGAWRAAEEALPHRPPMLFIDRVRKSAGGGGEAESFTEKLLDLFFANGCLEEAALFEIMAQAAGAVDALTTRKSPATVALLVGIKGFSVTRPVRRGDILNLTASLLAEADGVKVFLCNAFVRGQEAAASRVSLYLPGDLRASSSHNTDTPSEPYAGSGDMARLLDGILVKKAEEKQGKVVAEYLPSENFIGFCGHFPGAPVMPGFMQLMLAGHALRSADKNFLLGGVDGARFVEVFRPGDMIRLAASEGPKSGFWDCRLFKREKEAAGENCEPHSPAGREHLPVAARFSLKARHAPLSL